MGLSEAQALFLVNHLFLPPKLPHISDREKCASKLLKLFAIAAEDYGQQLDEASQADWKPIAESVSKWRHLYQSGGLLEMYVEQSIKEMVHKSTLLVFLGAQNSAVLITKLEDSYNLIRHFPAQVIQVPDSVAHEGSFIHSLAQFLTTLSCESFVPASVDIAHKGGAPIEETRQSHHPRLVMEGLITILAGCGQPCTTKAIRKRVRDEVNFHKGPLPWRRSAVWQSIKTALQLAIHNSPLADAAHNHYKQFMIYFLSSVADEVLSCEGLVDYHQVLRTKIARRASKFDRHVPDFVSTAYLSTIQRITASLEQSWTLSKSSDDYHVPRIDVDDYDTNIKLTNVTPYLDQLLRHTAGAAVPNLNEFDPPPSFAFSLDDELLPDVEIFVSRSIPKDPEETQPSHAHENREVLVVFQDWVARNLATWADGVQPSSDLCRKLKTLIQHFWCAAQPCFSPYPELISGVLLVIFELWMVLDRMTGKLCPIILDYSPELTQAVFEPLLLRKYKDLARLGNLEAYFNQRQKGARLGSIFDPLSEDSLLVRLYDHSEAAQRLKSRIEDHGESEKKHLEQDFKRLRDEYVDIMKEIRSRDCDEVLTTDFWGEEDFIHSKRCSKCKDKGWALNVTAERYEEILPTSMVVRKALVYELWSDQVVNTYRDCLWFMLKDVLKCNATKIQEDLYCYDEFEALTPFLPRFPGRVRLASVIKPHCKTHRQKVSVTNSVKSIVVPHSMEWSQVDYIGKMEVSPARLDHIISNPIEQTQNMSQEKQVLPYLRCLHVKLGEVPYAALVDTVHSTSVSPNNVIARQSACLAELHLSEWCTFGSINYGDSLHLINILRALFANDLNLASPSTVLLVEQILHQAGCPDMRSHDILRASDIDMQNLSYIDPMLDTISKVIDSIAGNWKQHLAALVMLTIVQRVLSLNTANGLTTSEIPFQLIRRIRQTSLRWIQCLAKLEDSQCEQMLPSTAIADNRRQILEVSLLTRASWNVDEHLLHEMFSSKQDFVDYVACSIYIHDYSMFSAPIQDSWLKLCMERDLVLQIRTAETVKDALQEDCDTLASGIKKVWPNIEPERSLQSCRGVGNRWFSGRLRESSKLVHINIATGSLLVASKPLSILPETYTASELYRQVLSSKPIRVIPSDDPSMEYMAETKINGYQLHFGFLGKSTNVCIWSKKDTLSYTAVPRSKFGNDLPVRIVEESIPWLCTNTSTIEFRNKHQPWDPDQCNWTISTVNIHNLIYKMQSENSFLIDNHRKIGSLICSTLAPLEDAKYIHVLLDKETNKLSIELVRYHLTFELDEHGHLYCNELAAYVTESQAMGTLYGLKSRLLVQMKKSQSSDPRLWVLIPFGRTFTIRVKTHVSIHVNMDHSHEVTWYKYKIDKTLRRLQPDQIEGHLWKAYLHACTSSTMVDDFTGRTGLEESFHCLDDVWLKTCLPFSSAASQILQRIADLSCARSFYPNSESRHMQQVMWRKDVPFMLPHDGFFQKVRAITQYNLRRKFLHNEITYVALDYRGNDQALVLAGRAMYVWRKHWPASFESDATWLADTIYQARDDVASPRAAIVFDIANAISSQTIPHLPPIDFYAKLKDYQTASNSESQSAMLDFTASLPGSLTEMMTLSAGHLWKSLLNYCLDMQEPNRYELLFVMPMIAYAQPALRKDVKTLLYFALTPEIKRIGLPCHDVYGPVFGRKIVWTQYDLSQGNDVEPETITKILFECKILEETKPSIVRSTHRASDHAAQSAAIRTTVDKAFEEGQINFPDDVNLDQFDVPMLRRMLTNYLIGLKKNSILREHCERWTKTTSKVYHHFRDVSRINTRVNPFESHQLHRLFRYPTTLETMRNCAADRPEIWCDIASSFDGAISNFFPSAGHEQVGVSEQNQRLHQDLDKLIRHPVAPQDETSEAYNAALLKSNSNLAAMNDRVFLSRAFPTQVLLDACLSKIHMSIEARIRLLHAYLKPRNFGQQALKLAGLWPEATITGLLQLLSRDHRERLPDIWLPSLINLAREICSLQRIRRIIRFHEVNDLFNFCKEVDNEAHGTVAWTTEHKHMDWLLFEIENDLLIRPVQSQVVKNLTKSENGTIQLQMGDGKTSVILPLFCLSVAFSRKYLVRVIALKSLAKDVLNNLSRALSGLVQTPVYWLPFSRATYITARTPTMLEDIWQECRNSQGVLVTLPEHLNSFRLTGSDQMTAGRLEIAQKFLSAQKFLDMNTRDIVDESDEILKPAYELVYTNGEPKQLSGTPFRWDILLSTLGLVQSCAGRVASQLPHGLEYTAHQPETFANIRILTGDGRAALIDAAINSVFHGALPTLCFDDHDETTVQAARTFITAIQISDKVSELVMKAFVPRSEESITIHLLRGLFAFGYLAMAFEKRFFVNYGLDRTRCMSAVPYRSKGVPATAAEFAQPDTMILLTALSYYYTGLTLDDMRRSLTILLRRPDPGSEYSRWISGADVPQSIRSANAINLRDNECVSTIHRQLCKNKTVIDFFLRNVVLLRESKEYSYKLSSSAWDLCSPEYGKVTCGFSGTVDSLLPDTMPRKQVDDLLHFDAAVLINLLQPRNRRYFKASDERGFVLNTESLLNLIEKEASEASMIIDAGAQILDGNQAIAQEWLRIRNVSQPNTKHAAVFFNEHDEKMVVTLDGDIVAWTSSPYKEQMSKVLVYLDQHRCRGTDLNLPDDFTAALLLGPHLPKDTFVQAAMRLRKLAESQAIVTFAPPEVDNDIRKLLSKSGNDFMDITDVIKWTIHQSCNALRSQKSLKALRHLEWLKRHRGFRDNVEDHSGKVKDEDAYIESVRQPQLNTVEELYGPGIDVLVKAPKFTPEDTKDSEVNKYMQQLSQIVKSQECLQQNVVVQDRVQEQEREQQQEREVEQEVQRPAKAEAKLPVLNQRLGDIIVRDSLIRKLPDGLISAFHLLDHTSLATDTLWKRFPSMLLATNDHLETIKSVNKRDQDDFLRPVEWIVKLRDHDELILIGPHEAQAWMSHIRKCKNVTLISYAAKVSKDMRSFDKLDIYNVSGSDEDIEVDADILTLLRLFAGQLYFSSFDEYKRFCTLLSIRYARKIDVKSEKCGVDIKTMMQLPKEDTRKSEYISFVKKWIEMRRKGVEWAYTDVGRVLNGEILPADYFE